jgi:hypothetical protein
MKILLTVIAIGEKYVEEYNNLFRKSHEAYANKNGYDFKLITEYLDNTVKPTIGSILFSKFLVCSQDWSNDYDYIVFIDADIFININSPPIHLNEFNGCIGIVDEYSQPTPELRIIFQQRHNWETSGSDYYKIHGNFNITTDKVLNAGLIVMQPSIHRKFLEELYNKYIKKAEDHPCGYHFEQCVLGYELHVNNLFKVLDNRFNAIWAIGRHFGSTIEDYLNNNYFIHFAGHTDYHKVLYLYTINKSTIDSCILDKAIED